MRKNLPFILVVFVFFFGNHSLAQTEILTLKEYYSRILAHHPVVSQANLLNEMALQEIRMARGAFDPKLEATFDQKKYDKKEYYTLFNTELKVPFWFGDFKASYKQNDGLFLDPENIVPESGLISAGISIPIGQDLLIDERRTILKQAKFFQEIAKADRTKEINKILLTAAKNYWDWYLKYNQYIFLLEGYRLAEFRYKAVKAKVDVGDEASIDSVEAKITLQTREIELKMVEIDLKNARIMASNHLWAEDNTPLEIPENIVPDTFRLAQSMALIPALDELLSQAELSHPELMKLKYKLEQLSAEYLLQRNRFLPKLNLNYNFLTETVGSNTALSGSYLSNNYTLGVQFSMPLFYRKERGKVELVRIKQTQTGFEQLQTGREIRNNVIVIFNELKNLERLINLQDDMVRNYQILRNGEQQKFENGESSLFLVISRENKLIEGQVKLEELKSKYEKSRATLIWAAGLTNWE